MNAFIHNNLAALLRLSILSDGIAKSEFQHSSDYGQYNLSIKKDKNYPYMSVLSIKENKRKIVILLNDNNPFVVYNDHDHYSIANYKIDEKFIADVAKNVMHCKAHELLYPKTNSNDIIKKFYEEYYGFFKSENTIPNPFSVTAKNQYYRYDVMFNYGYNVITVEIRKVNNEHENINPSVIIHMNDNGYCYCGYEDDLDDNVIGIDLNQVDDEISNIVENMTKLNRSMSDIMS